MHRGFIELGIGDAVASGATRVVFRHPAEPDRLIKVARRPMLTHGQRIKQAIAGTGIDKKLLREANYTIQLGARALNAAGWPVPKVYGFTRTSFGTGLVVERVAAADGSLGRTLDDLLSDDASARTHIDALNAFVRRSFELRMCITDSKLANFVYGATRDDPVERFYLVDGFGTGTLRQAIRLARTVNNRKLGENHRAMAARMDRAWDPVSYFS